MPVKIWTTGSRQGLRPGKVRVADVCQLIKIVNLKVKNPKKGEVYFPGSREKFPGKREGKKVGNSREQTLVICVCVCESVNTIIRVFHIQSSPNLVGLLIYDIKDEPHLMTSLQGSRFTDFRRKKTIRGL